MSKNYTTRHTNHHLFIFKYYQMNFFKPVLKHYHSQKKSMHFLVLMIFLCAFCNLAEAQNSHVISGVVQDNTGSPIYGVSVMLKGSRTGVTTDQTGKYSLPLPNGQKAGTIVFSYVGFTTQSLPIPASEILNVTLINKTSQLSDVVVVGYGTQKKAS